MVGRDADRVLIRGAAVGLLALALLPRPAAAVELSSLDGETQPIAPGTAGSPLVLHYFATWCPSCREELQVLDRIGAACPRVRIVFVDVDEKPDVVRAWIAPLALRAPVRLDAGGRSWRRHGFRGLPASSIEAGSPSRVEGPLARDGWVERFAALGCDAPEPSHEEPRPTPEPPEQGPLS